MTPNWLPQQPWMQMNMQQAPQGKSTGQGIVEGLGTLGTALIKRGEDDEDEVPAYRPPAQAPAPADPPIPVAPVPEYGARPVMGASPPVEDENLLAKRKAAILGMLGGGGYGL